MSKAYEQVLTQLDDLNRAEYFALMEVLLQLLRESETESIRLPIAWEEELDRRDAALEAGEMPLSTFEEVRQRIINQNKGL